MNVTHSSPDAPAPALIDLQISVCENLPEASLSSRGASRGVRGGKSAMEGEPRTPPATVASARAELTCVLTMPPNALPAKRKQPTTDPHSRLLFDSRRCLACIAARRLPLRWTGFRGTSTRSQNGRSAPKGATGAASPATR